MEHVKTKQNPPKKTLLYLKLQIHNSGPFKMCHLKSIKNNQPDSHEYINTDEHTKDTGS